MSEADETGGFGGTGGSLGGVGGTTDGVGGTTGAVGGVGSAPPVFEGPVSCTNPIFTFGEEAGYVHCEQGFAHRATTGRCPQTPLRDGAPTAAVAPACGTDADCAYLKNGRCDNEFFLSSKTCVSSCETDSDCRPGYACYCGMVANTCVPTNCASDADCGGELLCASYYVTVNQCSFALGFACQLPDDDCTLACPPGYQCNVNLTADPIARDCVAQAGSGGTCGRPFLVSGTERLARAMARADWHDTERPLPDLDALTATERLALAAHWQAAALMEHASIAAFARFTLQLLALGAPAELLEQVTMAIQDEQRHATTCFALASAFAGAPTGPGPLPISGCLSAVDLESVTVTTFLEGCIGEMIAAVEARELALAAVDPVVRQTLARIAEDESHHAFLAWCFLRWALAQGGNRLADRVHAAWQQETERAIAPVSGVGLTSEREHALGLPSMAFRADVRRRVLEEIVKPALDAFVRTGANRAA
jgi:hypothetical protein